MNTIRVVIKKKPKNSNYQQRDNFNQIIFDDNESLNRSALFLYLNKACFNGLYRVNSKGLFNVPFNQKTTINIYERDNLVQISQFLQTVDIYNQDFEETAVKSQKRRPRFLRFSLCSTKSYFF